MVVKPPLFKDNEQPGLVENFNTHLSHVVKQVVVIYMNDVMCLKIDNVNSTLEDTEDDDFFLI